MCRRVQHYGYTFDYVIRKCTREAPPFPECVRQVAERAVAAGLLDSMPDQCTVNEYLPGQGIRAHIDTHSAFTDGLMSLSLGSAVVMDFKGLPEEGGVSRSGGGVARGEGLAAMPLEAAPQQSEASLKAPLLEDEEEGVGVVCKALLLPRRSALVLHGAARYAWQHGIANRKSDLIHGREVPRGR